MTSVNTIEDDLRRETPLESPASRFCELGRHEDILRIAQTFENDWARAEILQDLCGLMPVMTTLGGPEGLVEIAQVMGKVGKWWT